MAAFIFNVRNFSPNDWKHLAAEQYENGLVPTIVPNVFGGYVAGSAGRGNTVLRLLKLIWGFEKVYRRNSK